MTGNINVSSPEIADIQFWGRMAGWAVNEAAALLLDISSDHLPEPSIEKESAGWKYHRMRRHLDRAREMLELESPIAPKSLTENAININEQFSIIARSPCDEAIQSFSIFEAVKSWIASLRSQ